MAAIATSRTILRETIGARLRRAASAGFVPGVMTTGAPTLTSNTTKPAALTQAKLVASSTLPTGVRTYGGKVVFPYPDAAQFPASWEGTGNAGNAGGLVDGAPSGEYSNYGFQVEIETDAPVLTFRTVGQSVLGWRLLVDGAYAQLAALAFTASGVSYNTVDFSGAATPRQRRLLRFEASKGVGFLGIDLGPQDRIYDLAPVDTIVALVTTDSYGAYDSGTSGVVAPTSLFHVAARRLGWPDLRVSTLGGTGYKAIIAGKPTTSARGRLPGLQAAHPNADVVVTAHGTNDSDTAANIQAEAALYLADVRARWPNALHAVLGPWPKNTGPSASIIAYDAAIGAAVAAFGDPATFFVPVSPSVADAWVAGTGYNGSNTTDSSSLYQGPDQSHLNEAGKLYMGARLAAAIRGRLGQIV